MESSISCGSGGLYFSHRLHRFTQIIFTKQETLRSKQKEIKKTVYLKKRY